MFTTETSKPSFFNAQVMSGIKSQIQASWWEDVTDVGQEKKNKWQGAGNLKHFPSVSVEIEANTCKQGWQAWSSEKDTIGILWLQ